MKLHRLPTPDTTPPEHWGNWQWQLRHAAAGAKWLACGPAENVGQRDTFRRIVRRYPFRVTPYYASLADFSDPRDPVLQQFLPSCMELEEPASRPLDPFDEALHMPVPGLIQRYRNRVLLLASNRCAVYCRHCTRKNTLAAISPPLTLEDVRGPLEYIRGSDHIREVIVSGGDPFLRETAFLDELLGELQSISHIDVVRIGTRVPVTLPMRITPSFCRMLSSHRPLWINTQFNHPAELTNDSLAACDRLLRSGIPVSNQAVLLRGINDSLATMATLCNRLQQHMIRPYYVFQCDPVAGTRHFETPAQQGIDLAEALRNELGGLALPRFVVDLPGSSGKTPLEQITAASRRSSS